MANGDFEGLGRQYTHGYEHQNSADPQIEAMMQLMLQLAGGGGRPTPNRVPGFSGFETLYTNAVTGPMVSQMSNDTYSRHINPYQQQLAHVVHNAGLGKSLAQYTAAGNSSEAVMRWMLESKPGQALMQGNVNTGVQRMIGAAPLFSRSISGNNINSVGDMAASHLSGANFAQEMMEGQGGLLSRMYSGPGGTPNQAMMKGFRVEDVMSIPAQLARRDPMFMRHIASRETASERRGLMGDRVQDITSMAATGRDVFGTGSLKEIMGKSELLTGTDPSMNPDLVRRRLAKVGTMAMALGENVDSIVQAQQAISSAMAGFERRMTVSGIRAQPGMSPGQAASLGRTITGMAESQGAAAMERTAGTIRAVDMDPGVLPVELRAHARQFYKVNATRMSQERRRSGLGQASQVIAMAAASGAIRPEVAAAFERNVTRPGAFNQQAAQRILTSVSRTLYPQEDPRFLQNMLHDPAKMAELGNQQFFNIGRMIVDPQTGQITGTRSAEDAARYRAKIMPGLMRHTEETMRRSTAAEFAFIERKHTADRGFGITQQLFGDAGIRMPGRNDSRVRERTLRRVLERTQGDEFAQERSILETALSNDSSVDDVMKALSHSTNGAKIQEEMGIAYKQTVGKFGRNMAKGEGGLRMSPNAAILRKTLGQIGLYIDPKDRAKTTPQIQEIHSLLAKGGHNNIKEAMTKLDQLSNSKLVSPDFQAQKSRIVDDLVAEQQARVSSQFRGMAFGNKGMLRPGQSRNTGGGIIPRTYALADARRRTGMIDHETLGEQFDAAAQFIAERVPFGASFSRMLMDPESGIRKGFIESMGAKDQAHHSEDRQATVNRKNAGPGEGGGGMPAVVQIDQTDPIPVTIVSSAGVEAEASSAVSTGSTDMGGESGSGWDGPIII